MAKPFPHTQVSHVVRGGRRRSQSVTIPDSNEEDTQEQSIRRKQFLAQLRNERQKQVESQEEYEQDEEDHSQPVVTRVARGATTMSMKKIASFTGPISGEEDDEYHQPSFNRSTGKTTTMSMKTTALSTRPISDEGEDEYHQPSSNRTTDKTNTMSMKKNVSSTGVIVGAPRKEITSISSGSIYSEENETEHGKQSQIIQIPLSESKNPLNKQMSSKTLKSSNVTIGPKSKISNVDSFITTKGIPLDSSQASSIPYASSSTNLMSKSEIFDQDFHLDGGKDHARRNDAKRHGTININGGQKYYSGYDREIAAKSSATFMAAIIAVIIGIIAFALGLSSLVLVLLLRSTVYSQLGSNSTNSSSSSSTDVATWTATCSSYTTLNDPTRSVFATGYPLGCDNTAPFINRTTPIWIRFIGTGGTQLPLTTPGLNICGSVGTGWYSGVMPSSGQIVNGTACFTWTTGVCQYSQSISVANCGSFYIYLLPPAPACMMRYCTI